MTRGEDLDIQHPIFDAKPRLRLDPEGDGTRILIGFESIPDTPLRLSLESEYHADVHADVEMLRRWVEAVNERLEGDA